MFTGILIEKTASTQHVALAEINESDLPEGNVTVDIQFSSLNYKDALAITGTSPVVRRFPIIPGIDLAGTVRHSTHPEFHPGMPVLLNGWGVGESHWGGLAQKAQLPGDWLTPLPTDLTPWHAMALGTAGYTAMLCIMALERHSITPEKGHILVTGATGGVGSLAIALLAELGYQVIASTGRATEEAPFLTALGASEVIARSELSEPGKPLGKQRWAGAIDVVGGRTLANVCASTNYGGTVAACGLAGSMDFPATVAPFILRGVSLIGIDSVMCPKNTRMEAWQRLQKDMNKNKLDRIAKEIGLSQAIAAAHDLLAGRLRGRMVVDVNR